MAKRKPNQLESDAPDCSMNALKHGLYARKWINPEEQELYDALFDEYCAYYEPVGAPEYTLMESIVASRVKILRFDAIEEANLDLAQSKATDPQHFLDSLGLNNDGMEKEFAALLCGSYRPPEGGLEHELINELARTPTFEISGWKQIAIDGHILRGIKPNGALTQKLSPGSINIILRNLQSNAGLNIEPPLSGHSFRVGRALDLLEAGESLPKIMLRGGWKTESTVIRYLRAWELD